MKSEDRIPACYKKGSSDWKAERDMLLEDGVTCKDCFHCHRCTSMFGQNETDTRCQFYPNMFLQKETPTLNDKESNLIDDYKRNICSEERPMPEGAKGRWAHGKVVEIGEQEDGWPGGDFVTKKCLICGHTWKEELPQ